MRFKIDDAWHEAEDGIKTFGALRDWVRAHLKAKDLVLLGVIQDRNLMTLEDIAAAGECPLAECGEVEFLSADIGALARRTCADMLGFLDKLGERTDQTVEAIERGENTAAFLGVKECVEGWGMVMKSYLDLLVVAKMDPTTVEVGMRSLSTAATEVEGNLEKIAQSVKELNLEALKECLGQDLGDLIGPMREAFERVQEELD